MAVFEKPDFDAHEQVVFHHDEASGLKAIIAIHNTNLGPATGGCRMWSYASDEEALTDALRLSRGMTYKNAMAGLPMGGGKSVILANPHTDKSPELFKAFGRAVEQLGGRYVSAEDVGITTDDMAVIATETAHVAGLAGKSGDPSPYTAIGTFVGIKAALKHQRGNESLAGLTVGVQGVGHVGYYLCKHLHESGAKLVVTDVNQASLDRVATEFGARIVAPEAIYDANMDIYAPCALGATLNDQTLPRLKATIVAGCANNQLARPHHDHQLREMGILYAPDYVINAGGIINVSYEANYDANASRQKTEAIYDTLLDVFQQAESNGRPTGITADAIARGLFSKN